MIHFEFVTNLEIYENRSYDHLFQGYPLTTGLDCTLTR